MAEGALMSVGDYEVVNGLLHRRIRTPDGEMASLPIIPDGGTVVIGGK